MFKYSRGISFVSECYLVSPVLSSQSVAFTDQDGGFPWEITITSSL